MRCRLAASVSALAAPALTVGLMNESTLVGVDLDNVCYDFAGALRHWLHHTTGRPLASMAEPTTWHFHHEWGLDDDEYHQAVLDSVAAGVLFSHGEPLAGSVSGVQRLLDAGFEVRFVTARCGFGPQPLVEAATRNWLDEHGFAGLPVSFSVDKAAVARELCIGYAIDDASHHYDQFAAAGAQAYLLDRPWNRDHRARRVRSWDDFVASVLSCRPALSVADG
jgi:hypothetical protein